MQEILRKLRKIEIQIRRTINSRMHGNFQSVFKGSGLEFADVRDYQYGDDVRAIDWNVSAKGHGTFVKNFREEKEQFVFFILDVSGSQEIGRSGQKKIELAKEITGVLAMSAMKENSHVGLICFSDQKELYIKPDKGIKHIYNILLRMFELQSKSIRTNLNKAIRFALNLIKRKSVVILISDFIDEQFEPNLVALARRNDLVVIHLSDRREFNFPKLGIIPLYDKEIKKTIWVNSSSKRFRNRIARSFDEKRNLLEEICKKNKANYLWVDTSEDYVPKLVKLFRVRNAHLSS
ncbi:MAG: DUF58 domain-containing protein [Cytophagaceae bacterium]|jgi:uncharacterized protein (DUF58 family)|nr:DUF58 domain-containing protein [Cytophagaceae bacterium]